MSVVDLKRSIAIYREDRQHLASLGRFYRKFVQAGDLVFDIGAHIGDRIVVLRDLGARVVAVEPQPALAARLRTEFDHDPAVTVIEAACDAVPGTSTLKVNSANPTLSTLSSGFVEAALSTYNGVASDWSAEIWDQEIEVEVTTIDALIAEFGTPGFLKIDVEGYEDRALKGLAAPLPLISFEITMIAREVGFDSLDVVAGFGDYRFQFSRGESHQFELDQWVDAPAMHRYLRELPMSTNSGDVYARHDRALGNSRLGDRP